ncbi:MAG: acetate/propionate family kinase, partial [Planctomycetia bacterium]
IPLPPNLVDVAADVAGLTAALTAWFADRPNLAATVDAVGHRIVHGGSFFRDVAPLDAAAVAKLGELADLAPLHNPPALAVLAAARGLLPMACQLGVFDTAFFADLPEERAVYPLPYSWHEEWGARRFGFHGISHAYCSRRASRLLERGGARLVVCHVGNGASVAAVQNGRAVSISMGFTPSDGVMMGTRCGSVDPGLLLYALRTKGLSVERLAQVVDHESGLLGVSGVSSDYPAVARAAADGSRRAALALAMHADRIRQAVGAAATTMGGVDALVFAGGIGENAPDFRRRVCDGLEFLGVALDDARNAAVGAADADVATAGSPGRILVVHTWEDRAIAADVHRWSRDRLNSGATPA